MEIPEHNPEVTPRIKDSAYWPLEKYIPTLSSEALTMLKDKTAVETTEDDQGEDSLKIKINDKEHEIPKLLTSKKALSFIGFSKERIDEIWPFLLQVSPPVVIPSVADGPEWAFWFEIKLLIGDVDYATTKMTSTESDDAWNTKVLDRMGMSEEVRMRGLKIQGKESVMFTYLQEQKPQELIPLIQRYIYHRWCVLIKLDSEILAGNSERSDWLETLEEEFEQKPINLDVLYGRPVKWVGLLWDT